MKTKFIYSVFTGGLALLLGSCSTGQMAMQNNTGDDVYNSNVKAKEVVYVARTTYNHEQSEYGDSNEVYYEEEYNPRLDVNRNNFTWRDYYYNNNILFDPFYYDLGFSMGYNNWGYRPGWNMSLGWNNWGWNNWGWNNYGWNNWGWNSWAYNPWYSPYNSPYWGVYSYYSPYYGGYYGNGYYGGGYYGGVWGGAVRPNNPRPSRGTEGVRTSANGTSNRIPRPQSTLDGSRVGSGSNNNGTATTTRPTRSGNTGSGSTTRPAQGSSTQGTSSRPTRVESSRPASQPTASPSPSSSRPSSSGSSSSGSSSSGSSSGGSSARPSRR